MFISYAAGPARRENNKNSSALDSGWEQSPNTWSWSTAGSLCVVLDLAIPGGHPWQEPIDRDTFCSRACVTCCPRSFFYFPQPEACSVSRQSMMNLSWSLNALVIFSYQLNYAFLDVADQFIIVQYAQSQIREPTHNQGQDEYASARRAPPNFPAKWPMTRLGSQCPSYSLPARRHISISKFENWRWHRPWNYKQLVSRSNRVCKLPLKYGILSSMGTRPKSQVNCGAGLLEKRSESRVLWLLPSVGVGISGAGRVVWRQFRQPFL
jgi:hypothetical protein